MNQTAKISAAVGSVALLLVLYIGGAWLLALHAVNSSQHNWCAALTLLTKHPVPPPPDPKANPSREENYQIYLSLKTLEHRFGC